MPSDKRFVVLSGPSGVGKGSLKRAVDRLHPGLLSARPILHASREPRVGEQDGVHYHFQSKKDILALQHNPRYVVAQVRSDVQAVDLDEVQQLLKSRDVVFAEVFYTFGETLRQRADAHGFTFKSVFLSPLPPSVPAADIVAIMAAKLTRRAIDHPDKIRERALSAPVEIQAARNYTHRLVNMAGEDDTAQWGEFGICGGAEGSRRVSTEADLGERARWLVETFVRITSCEIQPTEAGEWLSDSVGSLRITSG